MKNCEFETLYPFKSNYLEIDGLKYHYIDEGCGPLLVMLHGNPTWSFYYRNLVKELRSSYRILVPDHIGCGFSDKPQNYSYRLEQHIDNLKEFLSRLDVTKFTLICHDWGGPIGLGYAVNHPEQIEKIIVFNSTYFLTRKYPLRILICKAPVIGSFLIRTFNLFALAALKFACIDRAKLTPAVRSGYLKPYDSYKNRIAHIRFVEDIPLAKGHPTWNLGEVIFKRLQTIENKPMLICWGGKDFCFTDYFLTNWKERFPTAEVHRYQDAGHYVLEDAFDQIYPTVKKFLSV